MNKYLKVIIVEDETPAINLIKAYLKDFADIEVIAECKDGFSAVKAINENNPDIIFLDIQMPKLSGFEMLELLDNLPEIIFTTAYDEFALKAFEMNAVDYLMKPFSRDRFKQAMEKVYLRLKTKSNNNKPIKNLSLEIKENITSINRIFVKTGTHIDVIPVDDIVYIEAQDDYVEIYTPKGHFLKKETMRFLENRLPKDIFLRVHRSYIINLNYINKIEKYGKESYMLILKDNTRINVSKSRLKVLKAHLGI